MTISDYDLKRARCRKCTHWQGNHRVENDRGWCAVHDRESWGTGRCAWFVDAGRAGVADDGVSPPKRLSRLQRDALQMAPYRRSATGGVVSQGAAINHQGALWPWPARWIGPGVRRERYAAPDRSRPPRAIRGAGLTEPPPPANLCNMWVLQLRRFFAAWFLGLIVFAATMLAFAWAGYGAAGAIALAVGLAASAGLGMVLKPEDF